MICLLGKCSAKAGGRAKSVHIAAFLFVFYSYFEAYSVSLQVV